MKTRQVEVPIEIIREFSELVAEHSITNEIIGTSDEDEITVELQYEKKDKDGIFAIMELVDDFNNPEEE